jgi:amino acid permease
MLLPIMVKKELQELHIVSVGLFVSILIFILILFLQLCIFGNDEFSRQLENGHFENVSVNVADISWPASDGDLFKMIKSVCCILVAFSFANNLFPIYSSLKVKTNANMANVLFLGIGLTWAIYVFLAIVCLFLFGKSVRLGTNIMDNVNTELQINKDRYESYALQILFSIVLACHIPFIFFSGKESLCIIIDEIDRRSISKTLDERIAFLTR